MKICRYNIVKELLTNQQPSLQQEYLAFAPVNIALCKYWGKRDEHLNLPINDSLSISLKEHGTYTHIQPICTDKDIVFLNDQLISCSSIIYQRVKLHIDLFRYCFGVQYFKISSHNSLPTSAGLASSSSGFAALTKALVGVYKLNLPVKILSILARLGSGSACRSVFSGFVRWHRGACADGMDSYAHPLLSSWNGLGIGLLTISGKIKPLNSRAGMQRTVNTSLLYSQWSSQAHRDLHRLNQAILTQDFTLLGTTAEGNSLTMHGLMLSANPPFCYFLPDTIANMHKIWSLRKAGLECYLTMDAGPNIKILFKKADQVALLGAFPNIEIIYPFG